MENRDEIVTHLQAALYRVKKALALAPSASNLSDDLDKTIEDLDSLQSAIQGLEFDDVGMAV